MIKGTGRGVGLRKKDGKGWVRCWRTFEMKRKKLEKTHVRQLPSLREK